MSASLRAERVSHSYGDLLVLADVAFEARPDEVLGLVGPSGCGKTTLLELIAGLAEPAEGLLEVGGEAGASGRLGQCAYMPQRDLLLPWLSAIDNAVIAQTNRGVGAKRARAEAAPLFERFGLGGFERAHPGELSGGMRQRVAFLRTLLARKPVLLLDEPFGALDAITRAEMQEWLAGAIAAEPRTTVLVTHDVEEALYVCDRVLVVGSRPGTIRAELEAPPRDGTRTEVVTDPGFVELRHRALDLLGSADPAPASERPGYSAQPGTPA